MARIAYQLTSWFLNPLEPDIGAYPQRLHALFASLGWEQVVLAPRSRKLPESESAWHTIMQSWSTGNGVEVSFSVRHSSSSARGRLSLSPPAYSAIVPVSTFELDFTLTADYSKSLYPSAEAIARQALTIGESLGSLHVNVLATDSSPERETSVYKRPHASGPLTFPQALEWITVFPDPAPHQAAKLDELIVTSPGLTIVSRGVARALVLTLEPFSYQNPQHNSLVELVEAAYGLTAA